MIASSVSLNRLVADDVAKKFREVSDAYLKIGLLHDESDRDEGEINNPTLGAIHEFGFSGTVRGRSGTMHSVNIPERSFLRVPLQTRLGRELARQNVGPWRAWLEKRGPGGFLRAVGTGAVGVIRDAFDEEGPGWAPWSDGYARERELMARQAGDQMKLIGPIQPGKILTRTGQMRAAVSYEVVDGGVT